MKKGLIQAILSGMIFIATLSCKKDTASATSQSSPPPPPPPLNLSGTSWSGQLVTNQSTGAHVNFTFMLNGNTSVSGAYGDNGCPIDEGTWSKTPNSDTVYFTLYFDCIYDADYVETPFSGSAVLNANNDKLENGTLKNFGITNGAPTPPSIVYTFNMDKQ